MRGYGATARGSWGAAPSPGRGMIPLHPALWLGLGLVWGTAHSISAQHQRLRALAVLLLLRYGAGELGRCPKPRQGDDP
ncbi:MAG: hypothetical protein RSA65_00540, partial [Clostridia bacterium]